MVQIVRLTQARMAPSPPGTLTGAQNVPFFQRPANLPHTCSDDALCEAVLRYCMGDKPSVVAALLGVPERSLPHWTESAEWASIKELLKPQLRGVVDSALTRAVNKVLAHVEDRLEHGEHIEFAKTDPETGKQYAEVRRPLSTKTLTTLLNTLMERQAELQRVIEGRDGLADSPELQKLADTLARYGADRAKTIEAVKTASSESEDAIDVA